MLNVAPFSLLVPILTASHSHWCFQIHSCRLITTVWHARLLNQPNAERIVQSYLSEACHLLPVPASFSQGVDGHVAGRLGSLDGTDKVQTPKWCRERAAESAPAPRLLCLAGTPLCRLEGITDSVPEWFSIWNIVCDVSGAKTTTCAGCLYPMHLNQQRRHTCIYCIHGLLLNEAFVWYDTQMKIQFVCF